MLGLNLWKIGLCTPHVRPPIYQAMAMSDGLMNCFPYLRVTISLRYNVVR